MASPILVIEDDLPGFHLINIIIQRAGYDVLHATNGSDGLRMAREAQPALVVLDIRLPGINGYEVAREMKADPQLSHIPIIAVSVSTEADAQQQALEAGCDAYIQKPFSVGELKSCIEDYVLS